MKNYVIYLADSGVIKWFWVCSPNPRIPEGMAILEVGENVISGCVDTHKVVDGQLVLIE